MKQLNYCAKSIYLHIEMKLLETVYILKGKQQVTLYQVKS